MTPRSRSLLVVAVGVTLLAAGSALPAGDDYETTYVYEATEADVPDGEFRVAVHDCGYPRYQSRRCVVAAALAAGDAVSANASAVERPLDPEYDYVGLAGEYYRPVANASNGTVELGLEPVDDETVRAAAATNVTDESSVAARAVRTGTARTTERFPGHRTYVRYEGVYHRLRVVDTERRSADWVTEHLPATLLAVGRLALYAGGVGLVWFAGRDFQRTRGA